METAPGAIGAVFGCGGGVWREGRGGDVGCGVGVEEVEVLEGGDGRAGGGWGEGVGGGGLGGVGCEVGLVVVGEEGVLEGCAVCVCGVGEVGEVVPAGEVVGEVVDAHFCVSAPRDRGRVGGVVMAGADCKGGFWVGRRCGRSKLQALYG